MPGVIFRVINNADLLCFIENGFIISPDFFTNNSTPGFAIFSTCHIFNLDRITVILLTY